VRDANETFRAFEQDSRDLVQFARTLLTMTRLVLFGEKAGV